ncbi:MAG: hypothetical protein KAJ59_00700, partial [Thermodesulfovibrionia bacterium]|nr:hypothetical protein [Thermodesulfovibrionia bacterium]
FFSSCGYHMVGSKHLDFKSVTIKPVENKTYEPKLEESLHRALSEEFISQGIKVVAYDGDISIETKINTFELGSIAAIDENVQEQSVTMRVDVKILDKERVIEFVAMESPIRITFQSTGTVSDSVINKERAIDKACREIAGEIVGKMVLRYAE